MIALYDSDMYYIENWNYDDDIARDDLNSLKDEYDSSILLTGSMGLWDGIKQVPLQVVNNLEEILNGLHDTNRLVIEKGDKKLIVKNYHHDGCNYYEAFILKDLTKSELRVFLYALLGDEAEVKVFTNDVLGHRSLTKLTKDELITLIENTKE